MVRFVGEHAVLGAAGAFPFLAADFLNPGLFRGDAAGLELFDLVEEQATREEAVQRLLARGLALYAQAGGAMQEHDAGGDFIDVLAAVATGPDERLLNVALAGTERRHPLRKLREFVG